MNTCVLMDTWKNGLKDYMDGYIHGWIYGWMCGWMDTYSTWMDRWWRDKWPCGLIHGWMNCICGWMATSIHGWILYMGRCIFWRMDRYMDGRPVSTTLQLLLEAASGSVQCHCVSMRCICSFTLMLELLHLSTGDLSPLHPSLGRQEELDYKCLVTAYH